VIVPPGDPPALAAALRRLAADAQRRPLILAARARAMQHFSHDVVAQRTMEFWGQILK
jgi:glycosyltransferase involved in cell wall biosynthesis